MARQADLESDLGYEAMCQRHREVDAMLAEKVLETALYRLCAS